MVSRKLSLTCPSSGVWQQQAKSAFIRLESSASHTHPRRVRALGAAQRGHEGVDIEGGREPIIVVQEPSEHRLYLAGRRRRRVVGTKKDVRPGPDELREPALGEKRRCDGVRGGRGGGGRGAERKARSPRRARGVAVRGPRLGCAPVLVSAGKLESAEPCVPEGRADARRRASPAVALPPRRGRGRERAGRCGEGIVWRPRVDKAARAAVSAAAGGVVVSA